MRKLVRVLGIGVGVLVAAVGSGLGYVAFALPNVPVPAVESIEATPARLERGKYLAEHVTVCVDCHSARDWTRFSGPPKPESLGGGGERFGPETGVPGEVFAPNVTPTGIGSYSDGELVRAFTSGVAKDGRALFPIMPYPSYAHLCAEDVKSIVVYMRSLAPKDGSHAPAKLDFPMNLIVKTIPAPADPWPCPSESPTARGRYLTTVAGCAECHTPQDKGEKLPGLDFAGGFEFPLPTGGVVVAPNITPHEGTGIGGWTKEAFVKRFRAFAGPGALASVKDGEFNSIMPWSMYAGMTDEDLGAIYDYLRSQKPVDRKIERFRPN
jgi:mono/diheme cytochrome c family protein